jgi:hypothetical protein
MPRPWVAHPVRSVRRDLAIPGTGGRARSCRSTPDPGVVSAQPRQSPGRYRFRRRRLARTRARRDRHSTPRPAIQKRRHLDQLTMLLANRPRGLIITNSASGIRPRSSVPALMGSGASMIRCGRQYPRSAVDYYHAVIFIRGLTG